MATKCPKCNADNPDTQSFCGDCGTNLAPSEDFPEVTKTIKSTSFAIKPGYLLAERYKIASTLGKGGMGEVYLAEDTNLKRKIAIKVLPQQYSLDEERLARFEREARLLASLNHPNIAIIHGLEKSGDFRFLVMELVRGDTLADRLKRGSLPLDDSLEICSQIAEGLESAHEKGIIHRDLKPANVKVTPEGKVKILDFGIAKAFQDQAVDADSPQAISDEMTEPGVILGTAAYMSPEQAKGKAVDKRTDIWSFGCLLYECLTKTRAFQGQSPSETLASLLKDEPDWNKLPDQLPSEIRKLLMRCLQKDPMKRPRDIRDIKLEIDESKNRLLEQVVPSEAKPETSQTRRYSFGLIIFAVALIAVLAGLFIGRFLLNPTNEKAASSTIRFSIDLPKDQHVRFFRDNPFIAISPDGKRIAWIGETDQIFTRELSSKEIQKVTGTEDLSPRSPIVFSPDGLKIGFIKDFTIYEVPLEGGVPNPLFGNEDMTDLYAFDWGDDGSLVLHFHYKELKRFIPGENRVEAITTLNEENNEVGHGWPHIFPGSKAVLFCVFEGNYPNAHIEVLSLETGERHRVIEDSYHAFYSPTGHLIHVRDGTLYAVPFDLETLEVIGPEVPILSDIQMNTVNNWIPGFSLSNNGTIVYIPAYQGFGEYQLAWIDRNNQLEPLPGTDGFVGRPVISPDGRKIAYQKLQGHHYQIFVYDIDRQVSNQFTFEGSNLWPVWSPDGGKIAFSSGRDKKQINLFEKRIVRSQPPILIKESPLIQIPTSWHRDGDILAYIERNEVDDRNVWLLSMINPNSAPTPLLNSPSHEGSANFSLDGQLIVYSSNEQGQEEIFVREFSLDNPTSGNIEKVSRNGGRDPVWAKDGSAIFFRSIDENRLLKVSVELNPLRIGDEQVLLEQPKFLKTDWVTFFGIYDVSLDGERFVAVLEKEFPETMKINVILNWFEELKQKVPTGK